ELPESELARLRPMNPVEVASMQLTAGQAPLFLREARIPGVLALVRDEYLPVLVQVDNAAVDFGAWSILVSRSGTLVTLADPLRGLVTTTTERFEDHLAGIAIL